MGHPTSAVIERFPDCQDAAACRAFLRNLEFFLSHSECPKIVFDMSAVEHMNAAGIDLLLKCVVAIARHDGDLKLAAPCAQTTLVLELTQMNHVVSVFESVEDAETSFEPYHFTEAARQDWLSSRAA